ncbi:ABC transporter permease [Nocardia abscessus]|uniref:ABC transporter permease n=1 Tax=Nocardia abscessus TaxID=120957 RepID=UPI002455FC8B|nr:ABC transporter permease [Nocardia abscessus]
MTTSDAEMEFSATLAADPPRVVPPAIKKRRKFKKSGFVTVLLAQIVVILIVLLAWEFAVKAGILSESEVSRPAEVWTSLVDLWDSGVLWSAIIATLQATLWSLVIGVPLGVVVGLALAANTFVDKVLSPFLVPLNSLPRIALAPLFIVWFGLTDTSKVVLGVSVVFFVMVFNTIAGLRGTEPDLTTMARLQGHSQVSIYRKVVLPSSIPMIFAGIRLSVTYALLGVIASEMIAAKDGLGVQLVKFSSLLNISGVFAVLMVLAVIGTILASLANFVEKRFLRWQ